MELTKEKLKVVKPDYEALISIYEELDFKTFKNTLAEEKAPARKLETKGKLLKDRPG